MKGVRGFEHQVPAAAACSSSGAQDPLHVLIGGTMATVVLETTPATVATVDEAARRQVIIALIAPLPTISLGNRLLGGTVQALVQVRVTYGTGAPAASMRRGRLLIGITRQIV